MNGLRLALLELGLLLMLALVAPEDETLDARLDSKVGIRGRLLYYRSECMDLRRVGISYHCLAVHDMQVGDRSCR